MIGKDLERNFRMNLGGFAVVVTDEATKAGLTVVVVVSNLMRFEESVEVGELRLMDVFVVVVLFVETIDGDGLKQTCLNSVELVVVELFEDGGVACEFDDVEFVVDGLDGLVGTPAEATTAADKSVGGCC